MSSGKRYDVFLSYHRDDLKAVEYVAQRLLVMGISLFFDVWHLIPGSPWRESIEEALDGSQSVLLFLGPGGGAWEDQQMNAMISQRVKLKSLPPILVLLPGARKPKGGEWVVFRQSLDEPQAFERLVSRIPTVAMPKFPVETQQLIEKLKTTRFVAVLGPSDSDKSSIVCDGLLPALKQGALPDSQNWPVLFFTPTAQPLEELARHLVALLSEGSVRDISHINKFQRALETHEAQLHLSVRLGLRNAPRTHRVLLVVDQFEEAFTLCQDGHIRKQFLANLLYASGVEGGRVVVILIMQDDFLAKCADYLELAEPLSTSGFSIRLMEAIKFKKILECMGKFQPVERNPYVVGPPIAPDLGTPFFGRQEVIDWIETSLQSAEKPILVLYGQRRMGKTSVLRQIEVGPQGELLREGLRRSVYPVYIDLQNLTNLDTDVFLLSIAEAIAKTVRNRNLACPDPIEDEFSRAPYRAFNQFLDRVESTIDNGRLLLILDEFEELEQFVAEAKVDKEIFRYFRSQMQHRDSIAFLLAGTHRLEEMSRDYQSIIFNVALHQEVSFLKRSDATALIRDPVHPIVSYDDKAIDKIWHATRGHPYFIQFLCREIIEEMNRRAESNHISAADVDEAAKRIIERGGQQLSYLWDQSRPIEQDILATMAELLPTDHSYLTFGQIVEHLSRARASISEPHISKALDRLVARRIIKKSDAKPATEVSYSYSFNLLRKWIFYKHRLSTV